MKLTGAQAMVECLKSEGVTTVFGYPGAAICPFYDAMINSNINHILVRHEQCAGHAANGYARVSGGVGVCVATSGPGATNLITALATAYMDSVPIVAITGQVETSQLGRDVFQEADITGACASFTKHSFLIRSAEEIPAVFKKAFYIANSGRKGPVLIDIPVNLQKEEIEFAYPETVDLRGYKPSVKGNPAQIKRIAAAINEAKRPLICAGGGVIASMAENEVLSLSKKCSIPVTTTMMGLGSVSSSYPLYLGMLGMHGTKAANHAVSKADLLIIVGARAGNRALANPNYITRNKRIIHIDVDPAEIGKNMETAIPIVGNAKLILADICAKVNEKAEDDWCEELCTMVSPLAVTEKEGFVSPQLAINYLSRAMADDGVFVADVGQNQIWAASAVHIKKGRFVTTGGMGTMGFGLPAAIGAQLAAPQKQVVICCGDGAIQMSIMELATLARQKLPIKIVLMNNSRLGMISEIQSNEFLGRHIAVDIGGVPDFKALAAAYGIKSATISSNKAIPDAINNLLSAQGPYLLECIVSPDEPSM